MKQQMKNQIILNTTEMNQEAHNHIWGNKDFPAKNPINGNK
jgi:hypothetical protein